MVIRADVCQVTEDGSTLLTLAAKHGHAHLLSHLVKFETCPLDYRQMKVGCTSCSLAMNITTCCGEYFLPENTFLLTNSENINS